jgi:hypothetical protein
MAGLLSTLERLLANLDELLLNLDGLPRELPLQPMAFIFPAKRSQISQFCRIWLENTTKKAKSFDLYSLRPPF